VCHYSLLGFFLLNCVFISDFFYVLLCLTVTSICVMCLWHWISVLFRGVFQCGLFRAVFICYDFIMFRGVACAGVEGKCYEFVEKQGFV